MSTSADEERRYKRPESVLVLIYSRDGQVLLLRRRDDPAFWQSVTGSLEWDELPAQAAPRELAEETGIASVGLRDHQISSTFVIYPQWRQRYAPGVTENLEHLFSIELEAPLAVRLSPLEHLEYLWLPREQALQRASSPSNRDAIERIVPASR